MEGVLSTLVFMSLAALASVAIATFLLVQLPARYFVDLDQKQKKPRRGFLSWAILILKNLLGIVLVGVGVIMLLTPGQGLLTILLGIMLLSFPGKRRLERKLASQPAVLRAINRLRARFDKPPLRMADEQNSPCNTKDDRGPVCVRRDL